MLCHFREPSTRPLQTDDESRSGLPTNKVRSQNPQTQLPQRLHTMKSITLFRRFPMSHEQNMQHHLIYLATILSNTNDTLSGYKLLISIQILSCLAIAASYISCPRQPPSTAWLLDRQLDLGLTSQPTRLFCCNDGTSTPFLTPPPTFCDECIIFQFCYSKRTCGQPLPSLPV